MPHLSSKLNIFSSRKRLLKCSGCQYVYYCNRDCQKESWADHKQECSNLRRISPRIVPDAARLLARIIFKLQVYFVFSIAEQSLRHWSRKYMLCSGEPITRSSPKLDEPISMPSLFTFLLLLFKLYKVDGIMINEYMSFSGMRTPKENKQFSYPIPLRSTASVV